MGTSSGRADNRDDLTLSSPCEGQRLRKNFPVPGRWQLGEPREPSMRVCELRSRVGEGAVGAEVVMIAPSLPEQASKPAA